MMKKLLILFILISQFAFSQTEDALVYFADKEDVAASIANPITILTQEAIDRKEMHGTPIDERDVPVNEDYISQVKSATGITVYSKSKWMNCVYVRGSQSNINDLLSLPFVTEVEYMDKALNLFPIPQSVDDKFAVENTNNKVTYDYGDGANQIEMLSGDFLHEQDFTGEDMVVAFLDSGFPNVETIGAFSHVISEGRLLGTYNFAERIEDVSNTGSSHGTNTFSDVASYLDGDFVGTAPNASFYLFRTEESSPENPVEEAYLVEAMERADSLGVDVINISLGYQDFDDSSYDHTFADFDGQTTISARGGNHAFDKGMIVVTSAGNDGNGFGTVASPADSMGVLAVGAVDSNGNYVSFSSRGPTVDGRIKPDVMAKGSDATVITSFGDVSTSNGTSFSSPIMCGVVTCLWQSNPSATNAQVMQIVRESSSMYNNPTDEMGYGIPNFEDAYNALQLLSVEDQQLEKLFAVYPNPMQNELNISFPKTISTAKIAMYNVLGSKVLEQNISIDSNTIDTSYLNAGMYITTIEANNQVTTFKIVKR